MITLPLSTAHSVVGGARHGHDVTFTGVAIDSRTVNSGELFFAIPGEKIDPHFFLKDVMQRGAAAVVVERAVDCALPQLIVPSAFKALGRLSEYWRDQFPIDFIGVTGSNGKTTLKNIKIGRASCRERVCQYV